MSLIAVRVPDIGLRAASLAAKTGMSAMRQKTAVAILQPDCVMGLSARRSKPHAVFGRLRLQWDDRVLEP